MLENEQSFASYGGKEKQIKDLSKSAQHKLETIKKADGISKKTKEDLEKKQRKEVEKCKKLKNSKKKISPKLIGDTGEYVTSLLFGKRSTRYLSNQRKLDTNFNTKGFNHTIPDFLVTLNDYPTLVEVKNVQDQALTEQISFELKLAREYELDYLFLCNHYTKLIDNITNLEIFNKDNENHKGSRSGFIYHRHAHRSIKTIFKEIYLHHIKGAAPNKIVIKRLNLNDPVHIEEELNKNKQIQKN
ncbi:putative toxin [Campylobacter sp. IFREMER_LSEM_CL292]|uniref:putative toxin n=1 Tax=Campylobacter sp. IFREMER_LSEM_CL292 TaxID=2911623 RepID=UPI0021E71649|nr:putative toxin [Campylobacter sp. IFREMER_LSEM_CL292]MCV3382384.1 putative toxin [Campylobacter sp. IFREMER_LSEM_CL292]